MSEKVNRTNKTKIKTKKEIIKINKNFFSNIKNIKLTKKNKIIICSIVLLVFIIILLFGLFGKHKYADSDVPPVDKGTTIGVNSDEFNKLVSSKKNIEEVLMEEYNDGTYLTGPVNLDKAYDFIKSIKVLNETDERVDDYYIYYIFRMKDGKVYNIYLEGDYLRVNDKNYVIDAIDIKDDGIPDDIELSDVDSSVQ